jgi:hypothetical protein
MNYFFKGLREDNKKFWFFAAWFTAGVVALVDMFAAALGGSIFKLKAFYGFIILNITGIIALIIYKVVSERLKKELAKEVEAKAAIFEPKREEEIREILKTDPKFQTFCYTCIHFNHDKLYCARKMADERVKDVKINDRNYCLYWEETHPLEPET